LRGAPLTTPDSVLTFKPACALLSTRKGCLNPEPHRPSDLSLQRFSPRALIDPMPDTDRCTLGLPK
jgi:hypothetical protein